MVLNPAACIVLIYAGLPIVYTKPLKLRCFKYSTVAIAGWITFFCKNNKSNKYFLFQHYTVYNLRCLIQFRML